MKIETQMIDRILTIVLIISIIIAVSMTVYVIVTPKQGEKFTDSIFLGSIRWQTTTQQN